MRTGGRKHHPHGLNRQDWQSPAFSEYRCRSLTGQGEAPDHLADLLRPARYQWAGEVPNE